jgi:endogenous inhibitor of DNA gyrase (YacG/DUF329 family)
MIHDPHWRGFIQGITAANVFWAAASWVMTFDLRYRKCKTCGKRSNYKKSTCKEFQRLFCSEACKDADFASFLVGRGHNPDTVAKVMKIQPGAKA